MKTENQSNNTSFPAKEVGLTMLVFGLMSASLLGGAHLIGVINIPVKLLPYIGGTLLSYTVLASFGVTFLCSKFIFKKG